MAEETKRLSFDREQCVEVSNTTLQYIYDEEELLTGWERVYTCVSIRDENNAPTKIRFGTGDKQKVKWHDEIQTPVANVVHSFKWEFHARQHNLGVIGVYGAQSGDKITVTWHGYDKRIRER
ncbi:MAG: hypothetical protein K6T73_08165 [Candidatus Bathyarchaeota archaeon]|nr:hypothetical protein [Candidatus Bathyarchaeota archaeon]